MHVSFICCILFYVFYSEFICTKLSSLYVASLTTGRYNRIVLLLLLLSLHTTPSVELFRSCHVVAARSDGNCTVKAATNGRSHTFTHTTTRNKFYQRLSCHGIIHSNASSNRVLCMMYYFSFTMHTNSYLLLLDYRSYIEPLEFS